MKRNLLGVLLFLSALPISMSAQDGKNDRSKKSDLSVGAVAPDWELKGSDGKTYKLSDFKGKQAVVVAWYPMALTRG